MDLMVHLETFAAVAEEMSFSRAAEELAIAQPLLSRRIKTLEDHLGGDLFDRTRRQIAMTDFGGLLLPYAQDLLRRAEQLRAVARSARTSAVRALGVPPDCDPPSLARIIRAAADRGVAISVHELPSVPRAAAFADGTLALALLRVPPDTATLAVPLGLAPLDTGPVHLDSLRPRRGADPAGPPVLVTPEDDLPLFTEPLRRAAARAGLPEERISVRPATSTALAEMLAGDGLLLCTEAFARRHHVAWAPLADASLRRGYDLGRARSRGMPSVDWLPPLLGAAVGATPPGRPSGTDDRTRLAAQG